MFYVRHEELARSMLAYCEGSVGDGKGGRHEPDPEKRPIFWPIYV